MKFGNLLKEFREKGGVTQRELAARLDMDVAYLSRIENNHYAHTPSRDTIQRIAKALSLTVQDSDQLHILAGKIPEDVEQILFTQPKLMQSIRRKR